VIFRAFFGNFLVAVLRPFSLGFGGGCLHEPLVVLFPLIRLPNPRAKEFDFGVFSSLGLEVFLAGFFLFVLI
jgi:hypothetical protein